MGSHAARAFVMTFSALATDIDELGHVSNIAYVRWIQDAATQHSASVGFNWEDYRRIGGVFVVRRHEIDYLSSALLGDRIEIATHVESWRGATSERKTRIVRVQDGAELARAHTRWAYVSLETGRPSRIPEALKQAFGFGSPEP
jgi:acyl-CoA thioester hydrolase